MLYLLLLNTIYYFYYVLIFLILVIYTGSIDFTKDMWWNNNFFSTGSSYTNFDADYKKDLIYYGNWKRHVVTINNRNHNYISLDDFNIMKFNNDYYWFLLKDNCNKKAIDVFFNKLDMKINKAISCLDDLKKIDSRVKIPDNFIKMLFLERNLEIDSKNYDILGAYFSVLKLNSQSL